MTKLLEKVALRLKRKKRIRKRLSGTEKVPRLTIYRSANHVYAQVIDDVRGITLAHVHSFKKGENTRAGKEVCQGLGKMLAQVCKEKNIGNVVFDRNGYAYHGRVKAFADGAREGGLKF